MSQYAEEGARALRTQSNARMERLLQMNESMLMQMQAMIGSGMQQQSFQGPPPFDPRQQQVQQHQQQYEQQHQHQLHTGWFTSMREVLGSIDASLHIPTIVTPRAL
jgi:hypothetical protein